MIPHLKNIVPWEFTFCLATPGLFSSFPYANKEDKLKELVQ
jgi:hypothetical protein